MTLFGHPVHPMLIPLPIGAFVFSLISLIIYVVGRDAFWLTGSYWLSIMGVASGVAAAIAGLLDWMGIPNDSRNKRIGLWHMVINLTLVALFFLSWLSLGGTAGPVPGPDPAMALLLQGAGVLLLVASGWLGGEMVYGKPEEQPGAEAQPHQESQQGRARNRPAA